MFLGDPARQADPRRSEAGNWALILLVVQNSALVMVMHRSRNGPTGSEPRYFASTAVLVVEAIKLAASLAFATRDIYKTNRSCSLSETVQSLRSSIFAPDCWKLVLPAALYTLQNSLVYAAISNLDAVTFQVTYQLKILTTVLFSILLLGTAVSPRQWLALVLLTLGVALVQVAGPLGTESWRDRLAALMQGDMLLEASASRAARGLTAVVAASLISGLTCVYFEKLVKDSLSSVSLWTRNVQLSFFSLFPALFIGVLWRDGAAIARDGFFAGYGPIVWLTIALQAFGGLVVAVCIAYAGNVAKNFAASLSIVVSYVATALLFRAPLTMPATAGAAIVLLAMYLYHRCPASRPVLLPMAKDKGSPSKSSKPLLFELMSAR